MREAYLIFAPLFAFMLVPLWIPLVAIAVGTVMDALRSTGSTDSTPAGSRRS